MFSKSQKKIGLSVAFFIISMLIKLFSMLLKGLGQHEEPFLTKLLKHYPPKFQKLLVLNR